MRSIYKLVLLCLLVFMFRSPLLRLQQTTSHLIKHPPAFITAVANNRAFTTTGIFKQENNNNDDEMAEERPSGLKATKGLELLTAGTPNGQKVSIALEELKEAYGGKPEYVVQGINIMQNIQKEPWFTKYGPNGRIPVLVDHDAAPEGLGIMEGSAILAYLTRHFDPEEKLSFKSDPDLSVCEQWVAWQHGGLGPMQGQANHFYRLGPERIPYPTQRYVGETERLWGILEIRLKDRDYLAGPGRGKYSIADIANFSWVNWGFFASLKIESFPNLHRWHQAISARPAVQRGLHVPSAPFITREGYEKKVAEDQEYKEKEEDLSNKLEEAKGKYNYTFKSP